MGKIKKLLRLNEEIIKKLLNRPAIKTFKDNQSIGSILEAAYIDPKYHLRKCNKDGMGIEAIYKEYNNRNIIFVGEGGTGKTTAFLRLCSGKGLNNRFVSVKPFLYIFAPDLQLGKNDLHNCTIKLRRIIKTAKKLDGILLLDGLEEAFQSNSKSASALIQYLEKAGVTFWVSCRPYFYERLEDKTLLVFDECVEMKFWKPEDFDAFVEQSLREKDDCGVIKQRINKVRESMKSLINRPLFATIILFIAENNDIDVVQDEYELIELFLDEWMDRESKDKKIVFDRESSYEHMRKVALDVYLGKHPTFVKELQVFRDLLLMPRRNGSIQQFYHREFLVYFIVNAMIDAALNHPEKIAWWFSQTFYDDITNMLKPVLVRMGQEDSQKVFENLFNVYKSTYEEKQNIEVRFNELGLPKEKSFLKLRDEIIYFVLKLKMIDHTAFVKYVNDNEPETMLSLGIAYGMAAIDPNNQYTLDFAKKLTPGTPEEIRNRGWGMCFFGDVVNDGYEYNDDEGKSWKRIRENRLKRLLDDKKKYATRTLDIALLYCFYYSRGFRDCTSIREYQIIRNTNISLPAFQEKQRIFLEAQKENLVSHYRNCLLVTGLNANQNYLGRIQKEDISVNSNKGNAILEVDHELEKRIMEQLAHKEAVRENIKNFWDTHGVQIRQQFDKMLHVPGHNNMNSDSFIERIQKCQVLLLSANSVEGRVVTWRLMQENDGYELDTFVSGGHLYQFARIGSIPVVHIWPSDMSSFTMYGSFSAVDAALNCFQPKYIFAVGVAFGIDPAKQALGDVLVAKHLVFYDAFNKVTDGTIKLRPDDTYRIDANLNAQLHSLDREYPPESVGTFKWYYGSMLTGGTVLSDAVEKRQLVEASERIGQTIIGGEMEASGIHFACQRTKNRSVPFTIFKGICDWGAEKNGWDTANIGELDRDTVKDYVQAFACNNAYNAMRHILLQLNMEIG